MSAPKSKHLKGQLGPPVSDEKVSMRFLFIPAKPPFGQSVWIPVSDEKVSVTFLFIPAQSPPPKFLCWDR